MENSERREGATDTELALFLVKHIDNPCEDPSGKNIRDFYIGEAKRVLGTIQDAGAKKMLEDIIKKYSK